jgi:hypothetical protein
MTILSLTLERYSRKHMIGIFVRIRQIRSGRAGGDREIEAERDRAAKSSDGNNNLESVSYFLDVQQEPSAVMC